MILRSVSLRVQDCLGGPGDIHALRPPCCQTCRSPGAPLGSALGMVGHGVVKRLVHFVGPDGLASGTVHLRRYRCRHCGRVATVVPASVVRRRLYDLVRIGLALFDWAVRGLSAAATRGRHAAYPSRGLCAPERWDALRRWTRDGARLFRIEPATGGTPRQVAARLLATVLGPAALRPHEVGAAHFAALASRTAGEGGSVM